MPALKNTWALTETFTHTDANKVADAVNGLTRSGPYASRPTAGFPNAHYMATDNGNTYEDNGSSWDLISVANTGLAGVEPPSSGWTTTTLGTSTIAADKGGRLATVPSVAAINVRAEYRTLTPSSNYTFTIYIDTTSAIGDAFHSGLVLRNSGGSSMVMFGPDLQATTYNSAIIRVTKYTGETAYSADYGTPRLSYQVIGGMPNWYRIRDDGTNRIFEYSNDGIVWMLFTSIGRTDFITPNQVGWGVSNSVGVTSYARLRSFSVV